MQKWRKWYSVDADPGGRAVYGVGFLSAVITGSHAAEGMDSRTLYLLCVV